MTTRLFDNGIFFVVGLAAISWLSVQVPSYVKLCLLLMLLDVVAGVLLAWNRRIVNSSIMRVGLTRKATVVLIILAIHAVEMSLGDAFSGLAKAVTLFFIFSEMLSILENASRIGVVLPDWLKNRFELLKQDADERRPRNGGEER